MAGGCSNQKFVKITLPLHSQFKDKNLVQKIYITWLSSIDTAIVFSV